MGLKLLALYRRDTPGTISAQRPEHQQLRLQAPVWRTITRATSKATTQSARKDTLSVRFSYALQNIFNDGIFPVLPMALATRADNSTPTPA